MFFQGHTSSHQSRKPERDIRRDLKDRRVDVGQLERGGEAGP